MELRSAVIVPIPQAEPLVGELRTELDAHALLGVPAHVTVMAPFLDPAALDVATVAELAATIAAQPAFDATFSRVGWFGEDLVWLAPEPAEPFVALTEAVGARFGLQPYGGVHGTDAVAHLTVGHHAPPARLREAAAELERGLPVSARIARAVLMTGDDVAWTTLAELPLGARS